MNKSFFEDFKDALFEDPLIKFLGIKKRKGGKNGSKTSFGSS